MNCKFKDIMNIEQLQDLTETFYEATGISSFIITMEEELIADAGWQDICANFHRRQPEAKKRCMENNALICRDMVNDKNAAVHTCPHGLVEAAVPIIIDGAHLANFFAGQFLFTPPDAGIIARFKKQAKKYGLNETRYIEALHAVPVIDQKRITSILKFLSKLAALVAEQGHRHIGKNVTAAALKQSEDNYRVLVKNQNDLIVKLDANHVIRYVSPSYCKTFGKTEAALRGKRFKPPIHPDQLPRMKTLSARLRKAPHTTYIEGRAQTANGYRWFDWSVRARMDQNDTLQEIIAVGRDITDRKGVEAALWESESRWRSLVDNAPAGITIIDKKRMITFMNRSAATSLSQAAVGKTIYEIIDPRYRQIAETTIDIVFETGKPGYYLSLSVGTGRPSALYENYLGPIIMNDAVESVTIIATDITDREKSKQALLLSEKKYSSLYSAMTEGVCIHELVYDADCRAVDYKIIDVNPAFENLTKIPKKKAIGQLASELYGTGQPPYLAEYTEVVESGRPTAFEAYFSPMNKHFSISVFSLSPGRFASLFFDISEQKKALKEKQQLEKQLRQTQKMEAIGALAGGIAHDFNNILFPISGFTEMLKDDLPPNSPLQTNVDEILIGTHRARDLIKQILTFSRQAEKEIRPIEFHKVIKEVVKLIKSTIPKTIDIQLNINPRSGMVMADYTHIYQIVMNLATNAYHALQLQDSCSTLSIGLDAVEIFPTNLPQQGMKPGHYICLTVRDTGLGMNEATLEKIFDPYFTTKGADKGTGLGLSVVHGIVKSYGGEITVESKMGAGTVFHVYLPKHVASAEEKNPVPAPELPKGNEQLLLVDDEAPIVRMLSVMLIKLGYQVESRQNPINALEAFRSKPDFYDLVITDMTMPGMPGDKLAMALLAIRPDIPIIICTGFSEKISPEKAAAIGIKNYLLKPVLRSELAEKIRAALDGIK